MIKRSKPTLAVKAPCLFSAVLWLLTLLLTLSLIACAASPPPSITAEELSLRLLPTAADKISFTPASDRYLQSVLEDGFSPDIPHFCYRNDLDGMDEFGIFQCKNEAEAKTLQSSLHSVLRRRADAFDTRYFAEEQIKFEHASVDRCGIYLLYTVLDQETQSKMQKQFYDTLKEIQANGTQTRTTRQANDDGRSG